MAKWSTFKWNEQKWFGPPVLSVGVSTSLTLTPTFPAAKQTIVLVDPSTEFLAEQAKRSNEPAKRIWLYINNVLYDITDKFMSMGSIDRKMTYKPGETKLLTISDQNLVMSNADRYFSDLNPLSLFYDSATSSPRDYAGVDRIKVLAGFIIPATGYAEVLEKADTKLISIELATKEGKAFLTCQDSLREVFDIYVGMPDSDGNADPLEFKNHEFRFIMEWLLIDMAGLSTIAIEERITKGALIDDNGDFEGIDGDGTDIEVGGVTDWTKANVTAVTDDDGGSGVTAYNGTEFCARIQATGNNPHIELTGANLDAVFEVGKEYRLSFDYKVLNCTNAKVKIYNNGAVTEEVIDLFSTTWESKSVWFTLEDNNTITIRVYAHDGADETTNEVVWIDKISIREMDPKIDIEEVDLEFAGTVSFDKQKIVDCVQKLSEVARGNTVVLGDGKVQFRKFISEVTDVDLIMRSGENYSRLRYTGQDFLLKVNKVVVIGDTGVYAEAAISGETGITLKYNNDLILTDAVAGQVASECLGRFAVHPAKVEVTGEYLPSLDLKSVVKIYEPNSMMNPLIFQVRELGLDIVRHQTRMLLSIPDSAGRSKIWTTTVDFNDGVLSDVIAADNELRLSAPNSTGSAVYVFDMGA